MAKRETNGDECLPSPNACVNVDASGCRNTGACAQHSGIPSSVSSICALNNPGRSEPFSYSLAILSKNS